MHAIIDITRAMCIGRVRQSRTAITMRAPKLIRRPPPPSWSTAIRGAVLHASNADALRHPASLTKIMTLYLLFERLEAGKIKLDTPLKISAHAAEQAPTKLGVKPGQTLAVEDAIKAVVTKSANDAAVAIAENLGGDEDEFAKMMTAKAHALGMSHTTYVNASGLPNDDQITTAHDQAVLGRAIQERFPRYYRYFSTRAVRLSRPRHAQSQPPARRGRRRRRHQDRLHARVGLQSRHLGSSRRALHRCCRARRTFGGRARRAHARTDQCSTSEKRRCSARRRPSPKGWKRAPEPPKPEHRTLRTARRAEACRRGQGIIIVASRAAFDRQDRQWRRRRPAAIPFSRCW